MLTCSIFKQKNTKTSDFMKIFAPDYYKNFKCIADRCRHSCCIGWEIDIDDETFEYYKSIDSDFGKKLRENIVTQDECNCFKLTDVERCPFLNENNICDIILNLSEEALCQICNDHPRFRNFYSDRTEIGIGLCCEEAARLILSQNEKMKIVEIFHDTLTEESDNFEKDFFIKRNNTFEYFQNRDLAIKERMSLNNDLCSKEFFEKYLSLEILDNNWKNLLNELIDDYDNIKDIEIPNEFCICFEQLLVYFTYRHFTLVLDGIYEENIIKFIKTSVNVIYALCQYHISKYNSLTFEDIVEYSRMYSSEIEYSQENLDALIS